MIRVKRLAGKCSGRNEFFTQAVESCVRWECHFTAEVPGGRGVKLREELWPMAAEREELSTCLGGIRGMHLTQQLVQQN